MLKVKRFLKNNIAIWVPAVIVFVLMMIFYAINKNFPFGKGSVAIYDLNVQIIPLLNMIFDMFENKGTFFFSNRVAGGMNMFGTLVYFVLSPFYIIMLLGGRDNMYYTINIMFVVCLMFVAMSMAYALKKLFPSIPNVLKIILSLCYTFGGYVLLNYTFITWLTMMMILPLMAVAFKRMIDSQKYFLFSFLTFLYIVTCFGIGSTTQFILLAIYYLYILICVEKSKRKETLLRVTVAIFVGVMLSLIIVFPVYVDSTQGMRSNQLFDYLYTSVLYQHLERKVALFIADFAVTFLSLIFVLFSNKKDKFNRFLSIVLIGLVAILFIDTALMILNFGIYASYSTRMCFINSMLAIFAICKLIIDFKSKNSNKQTRISNIKENPREKDELIQENNLSVNNNLITQENNINNELNNKNDKLQENIFNNFFKKMKNKSATNKKNDLGIAKFFIAGLWMLAFGVFVYLVIKNKDKLYNLAAGFSVNSITFQQIKSCISLGILFVLQFVFAFLFFRLKKINLKYLTVSLCVLLIGQLAFSGVIFANFKYYLNDAVNVKNAMQIAEETDRVSMFTNNAYMLSGNYGLSIFSSMMPEKTVRALNRFGYESSSTVIENTGGTIVSDCVLGVKYYYRNVKGTYPNATLVDTRSYVNPKNNKTVYQYIYENNFATTGSFVVDNMFVWDDSKNTFENQNDLVKSLGATTDIFDCFDLKDAIESSGEKLTIYKNALTKREDGKYEAGEDARLKFRAKNYASTYLYYCVDKEILKNITFFTNFSQKRNSNYTYLKGNTDSYIEIRFKKGSIIDLSDIYFGSINLTNWKNEYLNIKQNMIKIDYTKDGFKVNVDVEREKYLFVTNVNLNGVKVKNNNKKVEVFDYATGFVSVKLNAGENNIKSEYHYPNILSTLLVVVVCYGLAFAVMFIYKKKKRFKFLEKFISVAYLIYLIGFCGLIYVFSSYVYLSRIFFLG